MVEIKYTQFEQGVVISMSDKLSDDIYNNKSVNFSRIDQAILKIDSTDEQVYTIRIYALNYQVACFSEGMFGLKFSK